MHLPKFLVIGGMKCGSTTLYRDLAGHPDIVLAEKELNALTIEGWDAGRYAKAFRAAPPGKVCGDISTTYSMLPDIEGVADRAARMLGHDIRILYLIREPIRRAISHHRHMLSFGEASGMPEDFNEAIRRHPSLVNYGRYATQLRPWRAAFGDAAISVIVFEQYIAQRRQILRGLSSRLGVTTDWDHVQEGRIFNQAESRTVLGPFWRSLREFALYRRLLRPFLSWEQRERLRTYLLPAARYSPSPPAPETVDLLLDVARAEELELRAFLQRDEPVWDWRHVRSQYAHQSTAAAA